MKIKHITFIVILIIAILLIMMPNTQARLDLIEPTQDPSVNDGGTYDLNDITSWTFDGSGVPSTLYQIVGVAVKILRNISIIITVLVLTILGVKYMIGSVNEKADYKKDFPNIIIGVVFIAGVFSIISVIFEVAEGIR